MRRRTGEEEEADTELKIIRPDNPTCYQLSRLRLSKEKQEGKRNYKSDGGVMVCEFVYVYVCACAGE